MTALILMNLDDSMHPFAGISWEVVSVCFLSLSIHLNPLPLFPLSAHNPPRKTTCQFHSLSLQSFSSDHPPPPPRRYIFRPLLFYVLPPLLVSFWASFGGTILRDPSSMIISLHQKFCLYFIELCCQLKS